MKLKARTFTVKATQSSMAGTVTVWEHSVLAPKAADAVNFAKDEIQGLIAVGQVEMAPTEISTVGIRGGITRRFVGWFSLIGGGMSLNRAMAPVQLELGL